EKRVILSYAQKLETVYGRTRYRFPAGHSLGEVRDWSFHARLKGGAAWFWTSDSHPGMRMTREGDDLLLDKEEKNIQPDRDVSLEVVEGRDVAEGGQAVRFSSAEHEGARYLMLRYRPTLAGQPRPRRDWVFLFESSGDRDPLLARVQIDVIRQLLANAE